jgi:cytosine permease
LTEAVLAHRTGILWHQRAGVWIGIGVGPGTFTVGGALAANLPLKSLLILIPLGTLVLGGVTILQAAVSRRRRERSNERAVDTFGNNLGSIFFNLVIALGAIGFIGFYVGLAGFAAATLLNLPGPVGALLIAVGLYLVNSAGLDRWNSLVWLTAVSTIIVTVFTFYSVGTAWAPDQVSRLDIGPAIWAIVSIVNYGLFFALRSGDFSWDLDNDAEVVKAGLTLCFPLMIFLFIGALVYRAAGDYNIADILAQSNSPWLGNLFLIISVIAPVMSGFHSGGLAIPTFLPLGKRGSALLIAAIAFVFGAVRFDRALLLFLDLLGAFIAPALVVMLLMVWLRNRPSRAVALAAWLLGSVAALLSKWQGEVSPVLVGVGVSILVLLVSIGWTRVTPRTIQIEGQE